MTTPEFKARLLLAANQIVLSPLSGVFTMIFGIGSDPAWLTRAREEAIRRSLAFTLKARETEP